jgi:ankyrin repeat protein
VARKQYVFFDLQDGQTPLARAVEQKHNVAVSFLTPRTVSAEVCHEKRTFADAEKPDPFVLKLSFRAPLCVREVKAFHSICELGQLSALKHIQPIYRLLRLLEQGDESGMTGLHLAAQRGCTELLLYLLQRIEPAQWRQYSNGSRADRDLINMQDHLLRTPLHWAILGGNFECTRVLLRAKANIQLKTAGGRSALQLALETKASQNIMDIVISAHHLQRRERDKRENQVQKRRLF